MGVESRALPKWVRVVPLVATMALAMGLRSWGLACGQLLWHPDEIFMVVYPLNLLSGDLNPHTFSYPGFHFYGLSALYGLQYLVHLLCGGSSGLFEWVCRRYLWQPEIARDTARWLSVAYSVGSVWMAAVLAGTLRGGAGRLPAPLTGAGLLAALLAAVNVLSVRQAPLAGTDSALSFWYAVATWAALRIFSAESWKGYAIAGALVGVCGATKYPGAAVAVGVLAAHLLRSASRRDRRIWLAGASAAAVFLLLAPYTLLDVTSFKASFLFQVTHAAEGRWGLRPGPLHQLLQAMRLGAGDLAWLAWLAGCAWAVWTRSPLRLVAVAACAAGYLVVNWGELVFARYVLPLVPLQAAIGADMLVGLREAWARRVPVRGPGWAWVAAGVAVVVQPLSASIQVARLQGRVDTRSQARAWIEAHVPPGSTLCNFGGWAGDPQVGTYEDLWWRFNHLLKAYDPTDLDAIQRAAPGDSALRYYSYAVQSANEAQAAGSVALIHDRQCSHVVVHEHALEYSAVDSSFRQLLRSEATLRFAADPGPQAGAVFDPMDAYYVALAPGAAVRPGPTVEVWEVAAYQRDPESQTATQVLARALSLAAQKEAHDGSVAAARRDLQRAQALAPGETYALEVLGQIELDAGNLDAAQAAFEGILRQQPANARAMVGLAILDGRRGNPAAAVDWYQRVSRLRPRDAETLNNLAVSYRALGRQDSAMALWRRAIALQPNYGEATYNLGTALYLSGDVSDALPYLRQAVELAPDSVRYCSNAAVALRAAGLPLRAIDLWQRALEADSTYADALFNIAYTYQHDIGDRTQALSYWRRARAVIPEDVEVALHGAQALLDLARGDEAIGWLSQFLENAPQHPRRQEAVDAIQRILAASGPAP